jgi:hypothetical protein
MFGRLSPAMLVALLALFIAMGGTAGAVGYALGANSVGTQQIVNGSIRLVDLHPSAVRLLRVGKAHPGHKGFEACLG